MPVINVKIRDKVATCAEGRIVCGNADYTIDFDFDAEWAAYEAKTARFSYGGKYVDQVFTGTVCPVPVVYNTAFLSVGVFAGDLRTTTPVLIDCDRSIRCADGAPVEPTADVYDQIMELLNQGGGGGAGMTKAQVHALDGLFKIAAYKEDASAAYAVFRSAFGIGDDPVVPDEPDVPDVPDEPDEPDVPDVPVVVTYTVTNNLTGVTSDNAATSVEEGAAYRATLAVADGFVLNSLAVTMGGVDITESAYGEGYVFIAGVTGDIVITAVAAEPQYITMSTGLHSDTVELYSDDGTTKIKNVNYTKNSGHSLLRTEEDVTVTVVLTNNTDADINGEVYIGCNPDYPAKTNWIALHYAEKVSANTFRAGGSVQVEYLLRAGKYLFVYAPAGVDISAIGNLVVHEPVAEIETATKYADVWSLYPGDETTTAVTKYYQTGTHTTAAFTEETTIRISIPGGRSAASVSFGLCNPTAPNKVYYNKEKFGGGASIVEGAMAVVEYTVPAGYAFIMVNYKDTVYIERM